MPSILDALAAKLAAPPAVEAEPLARQSPAAPKRSYATAVTPAIDKIAVELRPGLWRLRRVPAFPDDVRRLTWGEFGLPLWVDFFDHWYTKDGSVFQPRWYLSDYTTQPPGNSPQGTCCEQCGRRLFHRNNAGAERCALCYPVKPRPVVRGFIGEEGDVDDDGDYLDNVKFFLREGFRDHWNYPG